MTEEYAAGTMKVRAAFENMREVAAIKEKEILETYEQSCFGEFESIEQQIEHTK